MKNRLLLLGLCAGLGLALPARSQPMTLLWALDPGSRAYLPASPGDNNQRGMAYNPTTKHLLLVNRTGGLSIPILDAATGADLGALSTSGIAGGTFALNLIAVAEDGSIYAANLVSPSSATSPLKIYRWADETASPTVAYSGEPVATTRWGDNLDIRGAGNAIQVLFGQGGSGGTILPGHRLAVFATSNGGLNLTPTVFALTTNVPGGQISAGETRGGVAFGSGNTAFFKTAAGTTLRQAGYDLPAGTVNLLVTGSLPAGLSGFGPLGTLPSANLLAAIQLSTAANPAVGTPNTNPPHNLVLFDVAAPASPVVLDSKPFVSPGWQNLNAAGAVDFDAVSPGGRVFALDANNGLRAFCLDATPPVLNCPPGISVTASNVPGAAGAVVDFGVTATDNSGGPVGIVCEPPSGTFLPVGAIGVICTASDACGNASRCNFTVTVNRPPVPWFFAANMLPPANGMYVSPAQWHALYANGIILSNVIHRRFTQSVPPPPPNGSLTHNFGSVVEFDVSMDGGQTFMHEIATADVGVVLRRLPDAGTTQTFDTEMLQLNLAGGSLPAAVKIRESPTRPSLGRTGIAQVPGGYMIESFFDIFTELSVDGGQTWSPSDQSAHMELMTDPTELLPAVQEPSSLFPPPLDQFAASEQERLDFPGGLVLRGMKHRLFTRAIDPLAGLGVGGMAVPYDFLADFELSNDGGQSFRRVRAPGMVTVIAGGANIWGKILPYIENVGFDTEMRQLDIMGGDLPAGVMIRESPTLPSRGGANLGRMADGTFRISSFFDIFTEISLDGGQIWQPSTTGPAHLELQNITLPHPFPTPDWPPPNGQLASAPSWRSLYGQGVLLSNLVWRDFTPSQPPPPPGGSSAQDFTSQVDGMFSLNGGQTFTPFQALAFGMVRLISLLDNGNTRFFDTEMLQLNIAGGTLPPGMQLRESPTKASLGRTSMTQDPASGQFRINSFFDIFTELSLDGGQSWNSASEATPAGLRPPPPFAPFIIQCPGDETAIASSSSGAVVTYFTTMGIYPDCPFGPFTITCVPPSGSVFAVGTTTVTCTGSDGCGEHPTCSFKVKVLPQSSIIYKGFINSVIGSAVLLPFNPGTGAPASSLLISNISLSGLDGFKIDPGAVDGIAVDFLPFSLLQITSTVSTAISPLGEVLGVSTLLGGSNEMVQADFSTLGSESSLLQVSDGQGHLLSSSLIANGTWVDVNQFFPCPNGSSYYTTYQGPDSAWYRFCRAGCNCIGTNCFVERIICLRALAPSKFARLASLNIVVQPWSGGIIGTSLPPTGVSSGLRAAGANNAFALTVINERVQKFGHLHSGKGAARISSDGQRLLVANLGSSGEDGVAIDFMNGPGGGGGVSRFDMNVEPLNLWTLGTCLRLASFGRFNDVADVSLGTASLVCAVGPGGGCLDASVDFKAIGATHARVDVFQGGQPVGTTVVPTGLIGRIFGKGNIIGWGVLPPPLPCFWIQFDAPFSFVGSDNTQFTGTELRILAADPAGVVQDLTQFCVQGCNLGQLAITGESTPPPTEVDHFPFSTAELTLQLATGGTETVHLAGPSRMDVMIGPGGEAADTDGDGLDQVPTEMMALDLTGIGPTVGPVRLTLDPAQMTFGEIEETANNTPGTLDVAPFAPAGTASSFFDVFPIIEIAGVPYRPAQRLHWQTLIAHKPPAPEEIYVNPSPQPIPLLDPTGKPSGLSLGGEGYTPNASNCIQLICPTNIVVTTCKTDGRRVDYLVSATNRCNGGVTVDCIPAPGANFPVGTTIVNCTAHDAAGNSVTCKFPVTVQYCQQPPQILCPSNIVKWTCLATGLKVDYAPTVISPCDTNVTVVCNPPPGSTFPPGTTVVTCQVRDACGRGSNCEFPVTVTLDTTPPVITCPSNIVIACGDPAGTPVTWTTSATDDCDTNVTINCVPPSGSSFPVGSTTVTCTALDACGNRSECTFRVTINGSGGPPTVCLNPSVVVFTAGTTNDNFVGPEPASPSVGLVTRLTTGGGSLKGFDDCTVNRTFAHSFTNLPPCVTEAILRIRIRGCGDVVRNDAIGLTFLRPDGSPAAPSWGRYLGAGNAFPGLLATPWTANSIQEFVLDLSALPLPGGGTTDLIPTLAQLGFLEVTVQDDSAVDYVILTVKSCCCRNDIVVNAPANACCAPVTYNLPSFTNDCGGPITVQCKPPSGFCFPVGTTLVTCTGTDASGQTGRCFFKVIVRDAIPPVIVFCPTNLIACIDGANSGVMPNLVPRVIATDNCTPASELTITQNPPPGTIVTGGSVTFIVTDAAGNSTTCTQPMIVEPCCVPPPSGLVLWLPFDENAGLTAFNAAGGNNGQLQNGTVRNSAGYVVHSLCFDGINDVVVVPSYGAIDMGTSDLSIDAWIRRDPQSGNTVRVIVDKRFPQTGIGYSLAMSFGNLVFQLADAGGFSNFRDAAVVPADNQWHFVAVTVCRSLTNGGQFFVDGVPTAMFDPTVRPGNLNNPGAFLVGRSPIGGSSPWLGCIDEVEVFRRCLRPQEIRRIFNAREEGKCRTRCTLPWDMPVCLGRTSVVVTATICNPSPTPRTYNFQFHGLPLGPGCSFPGPTFFSPASGSIIVPPGGCVSFPVTIGVPPGMPCGAIACYELVVVPAGTRQRFACEGSIYRACQVCPRPPINQTNIVGTGTVRVGNWQLDNNTGGPIDLTGARLRAIGPDMEPDMRVISLNGLPPGVPWMVPDGTILPPGGAGGAGGLSAAGAGGLQLPMDIQFTEPDPGQTYTILLEADLDGDGVFEVLASMDVENSAASEGLLQVQSTANGTVTLTWPTGWTLEQSDDAADPAGWSDAPQQTSPLTISPAGAKKFYRLRQ